MKRLIIAGGLVGGLVLACSSDPEKPGAPIPPNGGSGAQAGTGGSAGSAAGTGGSSAGTGGTAGSAGSGGSAGAPTCTTDCSASGQVCDSTTLTCICAPYIPDHCPAVALCTDFSEDPDHCGTCDTVCSATSACSVGLCTPDPTEIYAAPTADCERLNMVLVGSTIYFVNVGAGTLSSLPVAGPTATELATGLVDASAFTLDDTNFYVVTGMSLSRIPLAGGAAEIVVTEATPIFDVTIQEGVLYYAVGTNVKSVDATATAGTGTVVGTGESNGQPQGVAVDGDYVLWSASTAYNVEVASLSGAVVPQPKLGASQGNLVFGAGSLRVDGMNVYWINGGSIERRAYDGGDGQENVATTIDSDEPITAFAINATTAYFGAGPNIEKAIFGEDELWMARGQGVVTTPATAQIMSVAVDATSVYWSTNDCKIRKTGL